MSDSQANWFVDWPSSSSNGGLDDDTMVELTVRVAGAVLYAPRLLRAWMTATETCVRDDAGRLLWLATDALTAWVQDGQLVEVPAGQEDAGGVSRQPAPEVAALRDLRSASLRFGVGPWSLTPPAERSELFGREVDWFDVQHPQLTNLRFARDTLTGVVLHVSGSDPRHGDLLVEVTSLTVLPRDESRFRPQLQL